jgi:hypothetical protein
MATYLISTDYIKNNSLVDFNVDDKFIKISIGDAQDQILEPVIGTTLYEKLLHDTSNSILTSDYQLLIVNKIYPFLLQAVLYKLTMNLIYRLTNSSVVKDSNEVSSAISMEELNVIRQERENAMRYHQDKLIKYLKNNTSKYPEYDDSDIEGNDATNIWQPQNFYVDEEELGLGVPQVFWTK